MATVVGSTTNLGGSTTVSITLSSAVPAGDFLVVVWGDGAGDGESLLSVSDTQNNPYIVDYDGDVGGYGNVGMASGTLAAALSTSDTLTLTFDETLDTGTYNAYVIDFGTDYTGFTARGNAEAGIDGAGTCTVDYTTINASPLVIAAAAFQGDLVTDSVDGWTYVVTAGGVPVTNIMDIGYQVPADAGTDLVYAPSKILPGYGAALVIEYFGVVFPPVPPNPLSETENPLDIRCFLTSLIPDPVSGNVGLPELEIPFNKLSFTLTINQSGPFSVEFQTEEAAMRSSNWYNWTTPGKSFLWVMVNGQLIYGGRVMNRESTKTTQKCVLTGNDFYSYWAQQMQFRDYTSFTQTYTTAADVDYTFVWAGNYGYGAPAPLIAITLMRDKGDADFFLPLLHTPHHGLGPLSSTDPDTWVEGAIPTANWIEFSAPISQMQTIDSLVQQMVQLGYPVGCDVFTQPAFDNSEGSTTGFPNAAYVNQYVAWPRAGYSALQQGIGIPVLDLNTALEVKWTEDSTSQTTNMWEQIGQNSSWWDGPYPNTFAMVTHHWPLLEQAFSHTYVNPIHLYQNLLNLIQQGDKNVYSFPQLAPVVTVPCFSSSAFNLQSVATILANDIKVANLYNPDEPDQVAPGLPFPPPGWTDTMRLIQADVTIPDVGVATMDLTLNMPPDRQNPPIYEPNPGF